MTCKDGTVFDALDGIVFDFAAADVAFNYTFQERSRADWKPFEHRIDRHWEDLAKEFEGRLKERCNFPAKLLAATRAAPIFRPPAFGSWDTARTVVQWREWPKLSRSRIDHLPISESQLDWGVEFDLGNGQIKSFGFLTSETRRLIAKVQTKKQ